MIRGWRLQLAVLLLAGALWSIDPEPHSLGLVSAYAVAWLLISLARALRPSLLELRLTRGQAIALSLALLAAPVARAVDLADRFVENERLGSLAHQTEARRWLADTPSIFPRLLSSDRPQTFYVHAPGARRVEVALGRWTARPTISLGHGLFRFELDPAREQSLRSVSETFDVELIVDGASTTRALRLVRPLAHPRWLRPNAARTRVVAVSEETDEAVIVDADGEHARFDTGDGPVDARFVDDTIVVAHRYGGALLFRAPDGAERELEIGPFATHLAVGGDTIVVARAGSEPELVIVRDGAVARRVELDFVPDWVELTDRWIVVSSVQPPALHRFDRAGGPPRTLQLGRPAVTMTSTDDAVFVAVTDLQTEGPPHLGNHFVRDQIVTIDVDAWEITDVRRTAQRTPRQSSPGNVDRGGSPMGLDVAPDGALWVAFAGTDDVWRFGPDDAEGRPYPLDEHPLAAPHSAVQLANGRFAVSSPVYGTIGLMSPRGERRALIRLAPGDQELLRADEHALQRRIGMRGFYESTRSGVACQSCHLHGGSDGTRHNIGDKTLVATLDTRGLLGTPPYLRDGGYPFLGSLDELSRTLYRGYLRHQGGRRISLDRFLGSLARPTPLRQLEGRDVARERRGVDAFVRARCVVCHAFPAFTNLGQHPVSSLFPSTADAHASLELDTPSLLGLGRSAPYLVDGRAHTLEAVFEDHDPARRHGHHRILDDAERADLFHLLEGL